MGASDVSWRKLWLTSAVGAGTALALAGTAWAGEAAKNDEVFTLSRAVPVTGSPLVAFDISWFDSVLNNYYLADRSNKSVDVIASGGSTLANQFKPGFVGVDPGGNNTSGPDGVVTTDQSTLTPSHRELWVGDGKSRVWVLDPVSGLTLTLGVANPIPTSTGNPNRADEMCYDPVDQLVMAANNADDPPFATIISSQTHTVTARITFDGNDGAPKSTNGAEQCKWSPRTGMFYISIPGVINPDNGHGAVAVINPKTQGDGHANKVVNTFDIPLKDCSTPQGMAMGPDSQILLGCNGVSPDGLANTVIINERSGSITRTLKGLGGNDEVWYNPGDGHYFLAEGQLPLPTEQLGIVDSAGKRPDQAAATASNPGGTTRRTHSVAADPGLNEVYVPIPATTTGFTSTLCADPTKGCIAVFGTGPKNDHARRITGKEE